MAQQWPLVQWLVVVVLVEVPVVAQWALLQWAAVLVVVAVETATSGGGTMGPAMASGLATLASGGGTGSGGQMGPTAAEYTSSAGRKRPRVEEEQADDDNCTVCAESDEGSDTASSNVTIDLQRLQADFEEEPAGNE